MFKERSSQKELLDGNNIPKEDLFQNLRELDVINKLLGGYNISLNALNKLLVAGIEYSIVDIGSGGGDTLKRIYQWGKNNNRNLKLYGIDLKQTCIDYSTEVKQNDEIKFICDDYKNIYKYIPTVDIIHACLFCHHLSDREIIELIKFAQNNNSTLIINDLERNPIAYFSIKALTKLLSKSYLVKNDAPLSVLRGFKTNDWKKIMLNSGAQN